MTCASAPLSNGEVVDVFTGIVEELGNIESIRQAQGSCRLAVRGAVVAGSAPGDSVAVNGVCLTVSDLDGEVFVADVMPETLRRTALSVLVDGSPVNLERAATLTTRLGGHLVQGHVDGVGTVVSRAPGEAWDEVRVTLPAGLSRYVVEKGSIALDGVSLTVASVDGDDLVVSLIPETLRRTTWGSRAVGDAVNVEVDVLAKHVERLLAARMEQT
jgi:riboflavin synthase